MIAPSGPQTGPRRAATAIASVDVCLPAGCGPAPVVMWWTAEAGAGATTPRRPDRSSTSRTLRRARTRPMTDVDAATRRDDFRLEGGERNEAVVSGGPQLVGGELVPRARPVPTRSPRLAWRSVHAPGQEVRPPFGPHWVSGSSAGPARRPKPLGDKGSRSAADLTRTHDPLPANLPGESTGVRRDHQTLGISGICPSARMDVRRTLAPPLAPHCVRHGTQRLREEPAPPGLGTDGTALSGGRRLSLD